jgi:hypothetical protein
MHADSESILKHSRRKRSRGPSRKGKEGLDEHSYIARKRLVFMMINSTAAYLFAYLLSYLFYQVITLIGANLTGVSGTLYYYEILFGIPNLSSEWTHGRMLVVSAVAPVLSMVAGYLILFRVASKFPWKHYFLLFLLWLGFHLSNSFLGGIIAGTITDHGIGYALDVLFWPVFLIYFLLSLTGLLSLSLIGNACIETTLKTTSSGYWLIRKNRQQYILFTLILPWLIGSIFMVLIKYTDQTPQHEFIAIHDLILSFTIGFLVLPIFFRSPTAQLRPETGAGEKNRNIWWYLVVATIIFVLLFRLLLTDFFYSLFM